MSRSWFPLEPEPRLNRELVQDARRYKVVGRPEAAAALWLPALAASITIGAWLGLDGTQMTVCVCLLLVGLGLFATWR